MKLMKSSGKIFLSIFCGLVFFWSTSISFAQTPPEIKAIKDKMSRGEKLTPEEQKQFNDYLNQLDEKLKQSMDKLKNIGAKPVDVSKPLNLPNDDKLPKPNAAAHYADAQSPTQSEYVAIVKKYNDESGAKLAELKPKLNESFAQAKTATDFSNLGMSALMDSSKDNETSAASMFAVTTGALKDSADAAIASNFGVLLKNAGKYQDSLKVLLYAEKLLPQTAVVQTNLGWTIAYLGDFFTAKAHFQKAINFDTYDTNAYEGMGLLYRVEGNLNEASKYLRLCLRKGFAPVAAKNLGLIEGKVDAVIATNPDSIEADSTSGMKLSDVLEFPYKDGQNSGGGKLQFADSPDFFSFSIKRVSDGHVKNEFLRFNSDKKAEFKAELEAYNQAQSQLDPIRPEPVRNGDTVTYPRSYELEVFALVDMEHIFARRHLLRYAKFAKRFQNEIHLPENDKFYALEKQFQSEYQQCARNEACQDAAKRKVCRARIDNIKGVNGSFQTLWTKYVQEERADLKRYFDVATPWLREIKNQKLNRYMNLRRELFIKAADPLEELGVWGTWEADVLNNWSDDCGQDPPPADTGNYLRNKLKVFPEPYGTCHVPQYKFTGGIGILSASTEATCDFLKVEFSAFGVYAGLDRKFGDKESDDITTLHIGLGEKAGYSNSAGGVNLVAKGGVYFSGRNGDVIDYGVEGVAKVDETTGGANTGFLKNELGKIENIKISAESGPESSPNDSPINFKSMFDNLDK